MKISLSNALNPQNVASPKVRPGIYDSTVKSVEFSKAHEDGKAIEILYELTSQTGDVYSYKEIFFTIPNGRTRDFSAYLAKNGIDPEDVDQFVGHREVLDIRKSVNGPFMTIVHREFVQ